MTHKPKHMGYAIMSKKDGGEWCKRTTFIIDENDSNEERQLRKAREAATKSLIGWAAVEPHTQFKMIDWLHGDDDRWSRGVFDRKVA